jgi:hypothetical protein
MIAVRKRQNIVQWSYRRVPLNVVPRIPLLGYPDIDQRYLDWSPSLRQTVSRNSTGNFRASRFAQSATHSRVGSYPLSFWRPNNGGLDPVGDIFKPTATGPGLVPFQNG